MVAWASGHMEKETTSRMSCGHSQCNRPSSRSTLAADQFGSEAFSARTPPIRATDLSIESEAAETLPRAVKALSHDVSRVKFRLPTQSRHSAWVSEVASER